LKYTLTVVMPAYNEEGCIEQVVRGWHGGVVAKIQPSRMLVVDDGSRDDTGKILDRLARELPGLDVVHQKNAGHGAALFTAYRACSDSEWVFQVDSDGQFLPSDFRLLWERRSESGFITGYRMERNDAPVRLVVTRVLRIVLFLLFGCRCKDSNIPFRLMDGGPLKAYLPMVPDGVFIPNIFLSVIASASGQRLLDIPVTHMERKTGTVSIASFRLLKVLVRCVVELVSFRFGAHRTVSAVKPSEARRT
jgi:glycosyltransferase involved in cell wall biosynthesis